MMKGALFKFGFRVSDKLSTSNRLFGSTSNYGSVLFVWHFNLEGVSSSRLGVTSRFVECGRWLLNTPVSRTVMKLIGTLKDEWSPSKPCLFNLFMSNKHPTLIQQHVTICFEVVKITLHT